MAKFWLINSVVVSGLQQLPGDEVDDTIDNMSLYTSAGAELFPQGNATVDAAAAQATNAHKNRGANESALESIMRSAVDSVQGTASPVPTSRTVSTTAPITGGGDLSANRTIAISAATALAAGSMSAADKAEFDTIQAGTGTLVAGTATISATITASSRIQVTMKDPGAGAITGFGAFKVPAAARVVGAPGSFDVTAIDDAKATIGTAVCTFDWSVKD